MFWKSEEPELGALESDGAAEEEVVDGSWLEDGLKVVVSALELEADGVTETELEDGSEATWASTDAKAEEEV